MKAGYWNAYSLGVGGCCWVRGLVGSDVGGRLLVLVLLLLAALPSESFGFLALRIGCGGYCGDGKGGRLFNVGCGCDDGDDGDVVVDDGDGGNNPV